MPTTLNISAASQSVQLKAQGLVGIPTPKLTLCSDDGLWMVTVPRAAFNNMAIAPGEPAIVSISLTYVTVSEAAPEPLILSNFRKDN